MNHIRNHLARFRLITFDVTDTLLEYAVPPERHYAHVINSVLKPCIGLTLEEQTISTSFVRCFRTMKTHHPNFGCDRKHDRQLPEEAWRWWWRTLVERVIVDAAANANRHDLPAPLLTTIAEQLIDDYTFDVRRVCWRQRPGVVEILNRMQSPDRTLGIVSNFDPRLETILRNNGIAPGMIDFVLTSYDAGMEKPDAALFAMALKTANGLQPNGGRIHPHESLHIGNLCREDYVGARSAGWSALLVNVGKSPKNLKLLPGIPPGHVFVGFPELQKRLFEDGAPFEW